MRSAVNAQRKQDDTNSALAGGMAGTAARTRTVASAGPTSDRAGHAPSGQSHGLQAAHGPGEEPARAPPAGRVAPTGQP